MTGGAFDMRSVLCDLDGTLVDTLPGIAHSVGVAVAKVLPGIEVPDLSDFIGPGVRKLFLLALGDLPDSVVDELEEAFRVDYDAEGWRMSAPFPGVADTLRALGEAGVRCFVTTNKPAVPTEKILRELGLYDLFEDVVSPDSHEPRFPSKSEVVSHVIASWSLEPEYAVLVGDSIDDGVAAQAWGIAFAAAAYGYGDADTHPELPRRWSLASFDELLQLVARDS
jgi:phosphoglycolate phosphatase